MNAGTVSGVFRMPVGAALVAAWLVAQPGLAAISLVSVAEEIAIGRQANAQVRRKLVELHDGQVAAYVNGVGRRLERFAPGPRYPYAFATVDDATVNAFALPGGPVWIHRGVLRIAASEAQVAGVVAHEIAHVAMRHTAVQLTIAMLANWGLGLFGAFLGNTGGAGTAGVAARLMAGGVVLKFSRDDEREADRVGVQIMARAGWDPRGMVELLETLGREARRDPGAVEAFLSSHPSPQERVGLVQAEVARHRGGRRDSAEFQAIRVRYREAAAPTQDTEELTLPNRLAREHSPYLLQHKDNPVDWYPWGDEAFARARQDDKPIFLSIGYSTCHWCHVMEHESFEDAGLAEVLNRSFVSIKVDREERPDVDRVYMTFVQATTGAGGWPMSVWLTPALEPFYGGTYLPPTSRWGKPGFADALDEIARVWRDEREKVVRSAASIVQRLRTLGASTASGDVPGPDVLASAVQEFSGAFDARRGGFGDAPKFPRPSELLFLFREHARTGASAPRDMALATLKAMALGGMRNHLAGGFHRYSVDGGWRVPHFEKMLYDQAQLTLAYVEAYQVTGDLFYGQVAADTLAYVARHLAGSEGGFFSAEDADSVPPEQAAEPHPHKMEGAFYIWKDDEIGEVLGGDAEPFRLRFGVLPDGNAPFDPQGEFTHRNLLYTARSVDEVAAATGLSPIEVERSIAVGRARLLERRDGRPTPSLDDKVITAWNGLMIAACARAARTLPDGARYLAMADAAARFVQVRLWDPASDTLHRRYRQGNAAVEGYAEDYACLVYGLLELFQAGGGAEWLAWALTLQRRQDDLFRDETGGGWFSTTGQDRSVLLRLKEEYDGAEPSATSIGAFNLLALAHLIGDERLRAQLDDAFGLFASHARQSARAVPMMLAALSVHHAGVVQVVVAGDPTSADTRALHTVLTERYRQD